MATPEEDAKVIELLQTIEMAQRKGIPPGRELDAQFEAFMLASLADRADLRRMLGVVFEELRANTEITRQVADVLASFRVVSAVAKWVAAVGAATAAIYHGVNFWKSP